jgi:hypothetical protein
MEMDSSGKSVTAVKMHGIRTRSKKTARVDRPKEFPGAMLQVPANRSSLSTWFLQLQKNPKKAVARADVERVIPP